MIKKTRRQIIQMEKRTDLPLLAKAAVTNLRLLNLKFEYLFFDDAKSRNLLMLSFPNIARCSIHSPYGFQRYDFFRYLAVHRLGGFYFDTDVLMASSLEDLLEFSCVFPFEHLSIHKIPFERVWDGLGGTTRLVQRRVTRAQHPSTYSRVKRSRTIISCLF
jgi:hypothetical protein